MRCKFLGIEDLHFVASAKPLIHGKGRRTISRCRQRLASFGIGSSSRSIMLAECWLAFDRLGSWECSHPRASVIVSSVAPRRATHNLRQDCGPHPTMAHASSMLNACAGTGSIFPLPGLGARVLSTAVNSSFREGRVGRAVASLLSAVRPLVMFDVVR